MKRPGGFTPEEVPDRLPHVGVDAFDEVHDTEVYDDVHETEVLARPAARRSLMHWVKGRMASRASRQSSAPAESAAEPSGAVPSITADAGGVHDSFGPVTLHGHVGHSLDGAPAPDDQPTVDLSQVELDLRKVTAISGATQPFAGEHSAHPLQGTEPVQHDAPGSAEVRDGGGDTAARLSRKRTNSSTLIERLRGVSVSRKTHSSDELVEALAAPHHDPVRDAERALKRAERARKSRERKEKRRFVAQRRQRQRYWLVSGGAILLLAAFVVIGVFTPIMAVRDVEVVGASSVDANEVEQALGRFTGVPLAMVGDVELHRALEPFPLIQRYSVERIPPHTLRVHIEERQPVVAVSGDSGYRLLDAAGVLTGVVAEVPAGIVRASGGVIDPASAAFSSAAKVVRDLPEDVRLLMSEVSASSEQDIEFVLHSGVTVVWGEAADTQRKAVVLRAMLAAVPGATRIDLSAPEAPVFL